jgi:AcrR family transcriptional regulator
MTPRSSGQGLATRRGGRAPDPNEADRRIEILQATCRIIGRQGLAKASVEAVAAEVGVARTLVYYYFQNRDDLLQQAFAYIDQQLDEYSASRVPSGTAYQQIEHLLAGELGSEPVVIDGWTVWSEFIAAAFFDKQARSTSNKAVRRWVDQITALIDEGRQEGSIPKDVSSVDAAERLTGIVDSLGERWMIGRLSIERARSLIRDAVRIELGGR